MKKDKLSILPTHVRHESCIRKPHHGTTVYLYRRWLGICSSNATRVEALGVNHLKMKNHAVMKDIYNRVFDGLAGASVFFNTTRR